LYDSFPDFDIIGQDTRQGFGGAINSAWDHISPYDVDYIFHLEDDFTFRRPVPLVDMAALLEAKPNLYQIALRRQAWNDEEKRAGGVIERWPDQFHQETFVDFVGVSQGWISHRMFYTTNPSLVPRRVFENERLPNVKDAEGHFFQGIIKKDPHAQFGYWGYKTDGPWVEHIGTQRTQGATY
jgi:hypothetical protein